MLVVDLRLGKSAGAIGTSTSKGIIAGLECAALPNAPVTSGDTDGVDSGVETCATTEDVDVRGLDPADAEAESVSIGSPPL